MKRKFTLILILVLSTLNITGCWDSIELRNREIVSAIGIDKGEIKEREKVLLTFQSLIPKNLGTPTKSESSNRRSVHVVSTTGKSISDALKVYREQISKSVYLQSNRVVVIGEDTAREGLTSILDFFLRYDESRSRATVLLCKGKASDIIQWQSEEASIPSDYIIDLITTTNKISPPPKVDMHKLNVKLFSKTTSPIITSVELVPQKDGSTHLKYTGAGVFDKDKLVGWLNINETEAFLWISNQTDRGFIETSFPSDENKTITQRATGIKTKIKPKLENGNITISLSVDEEGSLVEKISKEEINSPDAIKAIEESLSKKMKKDIEACLTKVQKEYKADVLGFGEAIHQKYPKEWKKLEDNWKQIYPYMQVDVTVKAKVRGTGLIIDSFK